MPLAKGKSKKTVSKNIQTLVDDYQKSGRIGTSKPANKKAAVKQAVAIALSQAGRAKPKKFEAGGSVNDPYNYLVAPGVSYEQQFAEDMKAKARAQAKENSSESSSGSGSGSGSSQRQEQRRRPEFLPLPNQSGQVEDQMPKFKQTRMQMKFKPDQFDVAKSPSAPSRRQEQLRKGGKVTAKKRR
jgi:hypothetical protein